MLYGSVGTGKTHLAIAPGQAACRNDIPTRFSATASLVMRLRRAKQDNRLDRELAAIGKTRHVILDELGYIPIDEEDSRLLFQIISDSYETRSIIHTRQHRVLRRGRVFGDPNTARRSSIDRTVHHGRIIRFQGDSYRSVAPGHRLLCGPHAHAFMLEVRYNLKNCECNRKRHLRVDMLQSKEAARLEAGGNSKDDYDH